MKAKDLKPCCYCGGKMRFYENSMDEIVGVQCKEKNCGATVIFFPGGINRAYGNKQAVGDSHNNRSIE